MNHILQLILLLVVLFAKEKLLPNLLFIRRGTGKRIAAGKEQQQQQQQGSHNHESPGRDMSQKELSFGLKRGLLDQHDDMNEILYQQLDHISKQLVDQMNAQHEEISQRLNAIGSELQQHGGVYLQQCEDDDGGDDEQQQRRLLLLHSSSSNTTTTMIIAKIDECFQEIIDKMENYNLKQQQSTAIGNTTKDYVSAEMERLVIKLQASIETKINQLVHTVKALSFGFAATVTMALGVIALPRLTDWIKNFLSPLDDNNE